jgi:negative regulator of flagellin synthesis FlgM
MADTISGANQRAVGITPKQAVNATKQQNNNSTEIITPSETTAKDSSVELSSKLKDEIAAVSFDSKKVEQIKQSIEEGNYPLNNKKIAESFIPLEKLL